MLTSSIHSFAPLIIHIVNQAWQWLRMRLFTGVDTGCGPDNPKSTVAIISLNHAPQLPHALKLATGVLKAADELGNTVKNVFMVSDIGALSAQSVALCRELTTVKIEDVVGISFVVHGSLQVLRFADFRSGGELCRVPSNADLLESAELMKETLDCLQRLPPIDNPGQLPMEWGEYTSLVNVVFKTFDARGFGEDTAASLLILMFLKALNMAFYTATTTVAVERFLKDGAVEWRRDGFLEECGLYDDEDGQPMGLREYGRQQAANARGALEGVFADVDTVLAFLERSSLAERFGEDDGHLTVVGTSGDVARVAMNVIAQDGQFFVDYKTRLKKGEDWLTLTNMKMRAVINGIRANDKKSDTKLIGYYAFRENEFSVTDDDDSINDDDPNATLITGDHSGVVNEINCQRIIRRDAIEHVECSPIVRVQSGLSFGVTFVTFCSSMGQLLFGQTDAVAATSSLVDASNELQQIAADISTISELSNLTGRLSGVVEVDGEQRRLAIFRRSNSKRDELIALLPMAICDAYFFDYRGGNYEAGDHDDSVQLPVFASRSVITVSNSSRLSPSVAQLLPPRLSALRAEDVTSWQGLLSGESHFSGGSFSMDVCEDQADGLIGLGIRFGVASGIYTLVSSHAREIVI